MSDKIVTAIILAAGESLRMGRPKQQIEIDGHALLKKTVSAVTGSAVKNTIVVLGHKAEEHVKIIRELPVHTIIHDQWGEGIGSSLKAGLKYTIKTFPTTEAILILVCDQPFLSAAYINTLLERYQKVTQHIVASAYSETLGVPALLDKKYFDALFKLGNKQGAKKIILENRNDTLPVEFPGGATDLDTPEDYQHFIERSRTQNNLF